MDHTLYDYSPLPLRPAPGPGARARVVPFVVLFLEHWELVPAPGSVRDPRMVGEFGSFTPDYRSWSQREYGLRIGIFRVIDALKAAGVRPAIAANAMALRRLPGLVDIFNDWGCEWLGHGVAATRMMHSEMPLAEQQSHIGESIAALDFATGRRPLGWISQDWGATPDTYRLLADAGIRYTMDWCNDDQPYWLKTEPAMLSIPLASEWDDVQCQWLRNIEPRAHTELALAAFDQLRQECAIHDRVAAYGVSIHPWLSGMPSRIRALRNLLAGLQTRASVAWSTPAEIFHTMHRS